MIKSMTGFASLTREDEARSIGVTVRAVNHRYLDVQCRIPGALAEIEARLRAKVQERVGRGRVDLAVSLQLRQPPPMVVEVNDALVDALGEALQRARERGVVAGALTPGDLLRVPQAVSFREAERDDEAEKAALAALVEGAVGDALAELDTMRTREGGYLRDDLESRRVALGVLIERVAAEAASGEAAFRARLEARVAEMAAELRLEPDAVAQEVVRLVARSDISEEVVRFRGHLEHWRALVDAPEPCGRKLDFLLQEMNREINTIGSKAEGGVLVELVVAAKAELEKMREQVQNVE
jgi:uncharacterized protein (TIGR00255 family)